VIEKEKEGMDEEESWEREISWKSAGGTKRGRTQGVLTLT
jgi:hypothetical protein